MKKFIVAQIILLSCVLSAFSQAAQTLDERLVEAINKNLPGWKPKNSAAPFDFIRGTYTAGIESDWKTGASGINLKIYLLKSPAEIESQFRSFLMRGVIPPNRRIDNLGDRAHLVETATRVEIKLVKANVVALIESEFPDTRRDKTQPHYYAPAPKEEVERALKFARVVAEAIDRKRNFSFCLNDFYRQRFPAPTTPEEELRVAVRSGSAETVKTVLARAQVNHIYQDDETALHIAVRQGCQDTVRTLIAARADVNARNAKGETPLMTAASYGDLELAKQLISSGADVRAKDALGRNAAFAVISLAQGVRQGFAPATLENKIALIKYFAAQGLNLNERDTHDADTLLTALLYTCLGSEDCKKLAGVLLDLGADVNAENKYGKTALINAVERSNATVRNESVRLLLARGADPRHRDKNNLTALGYTLKDQQLYRNDPTFSKHIGETIRLLKDAGAIE